MSLKGSPRRRWAIVAAVTALFVLPALTSHLAGRWVVGAGMVKVGEPVPAFTAQTLDGQTITTDDFMGQITVLNFWATWCGPCRAEMPALDAVHNPVDGVQVLAVNNVEPAATVAAFVDAFGLSLPILLDPDARLQQQFGVMGYPTTVFVAADGVVYAVHAGAMTQTQLTEKIAAGR